MRVLLIDDGSSLDLAQRLASDGSDVTYFQSNLKAPETPCGEGILEELGVHRTSNYMMSLDNSDLVVFSSSGWGDDVDFLRERGYKVFGAGREAETLGRNQTLAQRLFKQFGMDIPKTRGMRASEAKITVQTLNRPFVIKHAKSRVQAYVPLNVEDCLGKIEKISQRNPNEDILLEDAMDGIEASVSGFFNGTTFVKPFCVSFAHNHLLDGDIGPLCSGQAIASLYTSQDLPFIKYLTKLEGHLKRVAHRGVFGITCIVNEDGYWVVKSHSYWKAPNRIVQSSLHEDKTSDIIAGIAKGSLNNFNALEDTWAVGVSLNLAGHPFDEVVKKAEALRVYGIEDALDDKCQLSFVSLAKRNGKYYTSPGRGRVLVINGTGKTLKEARSNAYRAMDHINFQGISYRLDSGLRIERNDQNLILWGVIPKQEEQDEKNSNGCNCYGET